MKRTLSDADLVDKAKEIDELPFPFEKLPTDLIYKIFMDSGFTMQELHMLCNLSKKLKAICTNRNVWEQVLFKHVLGYGKEMRRAERERRLPELMAEIRANNGYYAIWKSIQNYDPFVVLTAIQLWLNYSYRRLYLLHVDDEEENPLIIEENARNREVRISYYTFQSAYTKALEQIVKLVKPEEVLTNTNEERKNVYTGKSYRAPRIQLSNKIGAKEWILYFCFLLDNGWIWVSSDGAKATRRVFDTTPLASCVTCGNASFDQLGKCSCPCKQIFCSVMCQSKLH